MCHRAAGRVQEREGHVALSSPLYPEGASFFGAPRLDHGNPVPSLSFATVHLKLLIFDPWENPNKVPNLIICEHKCINSSFHNRTMVTFSPQLPRTSPTHPVFLRVWVWKWLMPPWGCIQLEGNRELWCLTTWSYILTLPLSSCRICDLLSFLKPQFTHM